MLGGLLTVLQEPLVKSVSFDPFSVLQDLIAASEVDVGRCQVLQAFMVSAMIVVADEPADLALQVTGQEVVFQEDAVLQGLVPSLDLTLGLWMVWSTTNMIHAFVIEPFGEFGGDVTGTIIRQQPWPMMNVDLIAT